MAVKIAVTSMLLAFSMPSISAVDVRFFQNDIKVIGNNGSSIDIPYSDYGAVRISYTPGEQLQYFNLVVDDVWVVRNMPLGAFGGSGVETATITNFGLGVDRGQQLTSLTYGFSVGTSTVALPPTTTGVAPVFSRSVAGGGGLGDDVGPRLPFVPPPPPPPPITPDGDIALAGEVHRDFPNQDVDPNFCVPGAVSNSLRFLNRRWSLELPEEKMRVGTIAAAFGTTTTEATRGDWVEKKRKYTTDEKISINTITTTDFDKIFEYIRAGFDVEIQSSESFFVTENGVLVKKKRGHVAAVVGIWKTLDGQYILNIAHDTDQNNKGGNEYPETGYYDPRTKKLNGVTWLEDYSFDYFVVESVVPEPSTWACMIVGFGLLGWRVRRRADQSAARVSA